MTLIIACNRLENSLSSSEKKEIESEIITVYQHHIIDLKNLDYEQVMKFYTKDHILFGDGSYWGGYERVDEIWKWCMHNWQVITKWDLKNHQVHVFSDKAASYLVEYDCERIEPDGDTTKVTGCFSYGMQRFPQGWKAATAHVTHNYLPGYDPRE